MEQAIGGYGLPGVCRTEEFGTEDGLCTVYLFRNNSDEAIADATPYYSIFEMEVDDGSDLIRIINSIHKEDIKKLK